MSISPINTGRTEFHAENYSVALGAVIIYGVVIGTYIVPSKARARLLSFGNYLDTVAKWGLVVWHLNCNGIPCAPYNAVLDQIGYAAQRSEVERLEFGGGSIITVTADNTTIGAVSAGCSVSWELIFQE
jgi:hypothetical protein